MDIKPDKKPYYFVRLLQSAWGVTMADLSPGKPRIVLKKLAVTVISIFLLYSYGLSGIAKGQIQEVLAVLVAFLLGGPVYFFVNLVLAPSRMQRDADGHITSLEKKIYDAEKQQEALNRLWALRSEAISLRNEPVANQGEFVDWERRYKKMREQILAAANQRDPNLKEWLMRLERMGPPPPDLKFYDDYTVVPGGKMEIGGREHRRLASILTEILVRLQKHLEKGLV